ncbi:hypothetical protein [Methylobacterium sp. 10]|uniref:hypothetical protein n=1 Tax=Methylobacterium sp. 10 TaxID=1101191 RepID=UPI0004BBFEE9|nr:hypothetical protein [Methylobacterium sp. 10]
MSYWIEFYEQGNKIGETPAPGSEDEAREHAKQGLVTHKADFARIVDVDADGAEVWSVHADTAEARIPKP